MAHCVKVVLDDACARSLQQEEALHSAGDTAIALSPATEHATTSSSFSLSEDLPDSSSERESPKMVAKVLAHKCKNKSSCLSPHSNG